MAEDAVVEYRIPPLGGAPFVPDYDVGRARVRTDPILRPSEVAALASEPLVG